MTQTTIKRLNWGCGHRGVPGWINSDRKSGRGIDISCDIRAGLPLDSDSMDYAVSIHALVEVPYPEIVPVLAELRRVIKPGGVLRLGLPDLLKSVHAYERGQRDFFLIPDEDAKSLGAKFIVQLIWYGYSHTLFVPEFAQEMLLKAGYSKVSPCAYRQTTTSHAGITELDDRENESFFVEAYKQDHGAMTQRTVLVSGALANKPGNGGEAWVRLSWVRGLARLGFRVVFVEQIDPRVCVDAAGAPSSFPQSANLAFFRRVVEQFDMTRDACLICVGAGTDLERGGTIQPGIESFGIPTQDLLALAESADLLVNISGHLNLPSLLCRLRRKTYVDVDPGYTQFWHAAGNPGARLEGHDHFFTIGERIGTSACAIPTSGIHWRPTRQPVVIDDWALTAPPTPAGRKFTTVGAWRGGYGVVEHAGVRYGLKCHEFRKLADLPRRIGAHFEIALNIHPSDAKDADLLTQGGWHLADPHQVAGDPFTFRQYVRDSAAECSAAQGMYVQTACGWFADRTVRYLASGRPAVVQETGFTGLIPTGEGLIPFNTPHEAAEGVKRILHDYDHQCRAARDIALECFESTRVLSRFIDEVGIAP